MWHTVYNGLDEIKMFEDMEKSDFSTFLDLILGPRGIKLHSIQ